MTKQNLTATLLFFIILLSACRKENKTLSEPIVTNIEIGLNNNETAYIGKDFHFNASIVAVGKIENVEIKILPRVGETYSKPWKHEIKWDQYRGAKNTTVHKHFDISPDAATGNYDFIIIVNDQNGSRKEIARSLSIKA